MEISKLTMESVGKLSTDQVQELMCELKASAKEHPENIWIRMGLENCCQVMAQRMSGEGIDWKPAYRAISDKINEDLTMPDFLGRKINTQANVTSHFVGETVLNVAQIGKQAVTSTYLALRKMFTKK